MSDICDICFVDTETLGLHPQSPIWEFAALRVFADGAEDSALFQIRHEPGVYLDEMAASGPIGAQLAEDYRARYSPADAFGERDAAIMIHLVTRSALVVGCNPGFDLDSQRLAGLLRRNGIEPEWHYHPLDTASMAIARLAAQDRLPEQPWKSDQLSSLIGVYPHEFPRHTAMGDVQWCRAQWNVLMKPLPRVENLEPWHGKAVGSQ